MKESFDLELARKRCSICGTPRQGEIDDFLWHHGPALEAGESEHSWRSAARRFGTTHQSLTRHYRRHFQPPACAICGKPAQAGDELCERCRRLEEIGEREGPFARRGAAPTGESYIVNRNWWAIQKWMETQSS